MNRINRVEEDIRLLQAKSESVQAGSVDVAFDDSELVSKYRKLAQRFRIDEGDTTIKEQKVATEKGRFTKFGDKYSYSFGIPIISSSRKYYPDKMYWEKYEYTSGSNLIEAYRLKNDRSLTYAIRYIAPILACKVWPMATVTDAQWLTIKNTLTLPYCGPLAITNAVPAQSSHKSKMIIPYLTSGFMSYSFPFNGQSAGLYIDLGVIGTDELFHHFLTKYDSAYAKASTYIATGDGTYPYVLGSMTYIKQFSLFKLNGDHYEPERTYSKGPWMDYHFVSQFSNKPVRNSSGVILADGDTISPASLSPVQDYYNPLNNGIAYRAYEQLHNPVNSFYSYSLKATLPFGKIVNLPAISAYTYTDDYNLNELPIYAPLSINSDLTDPTSTIIHTNKSWNSKGVTYSPGQGCHIAVSYPNMIVKSDIEINRMRREGVSSTSLTEPWAIMCLTKDHYGWDDMGIFEVARYGLE